MNKLIKNEFIKILKRKSLYLIILLMIIMMSCITLFKSMKETKDDSILLKEKNDLEIELSNYDAEYLKGEYLEDYLSCITKLDIVKLKLEFGENSWQSNVVADYYNFYTLRYNINLSTYENKKDIESVKKYNKLVDLLKNKDWKAFARYEIDILNEEGNQAEVEKLQFRLEKDVSFETSFLDEAVKEYFVNKEMIKEYENRNELTYEEKLKYQELKESIEIDKYIIDSRKDIKNKEGIRGEIINFYENYNLLLLLIIIGISSIIIIDEFKTGNIKNILILPKKRWKIYISKLITCFVLSIVLYSIIGIIHFLISLIIYGSKGLDIPSVIYMPDKNKIITFNIILLYLYNLLLNLPLIIANILFLCMVGVIFNEYIETEIFSLLFLSCGTLLIDKLENLGKSFHMLSIFYNMDFEALLFGRLHKYEYMSLGHSVTVFVVYCLIFLIITMIAVNKKDIENYNN